MSGKSTQLCPQCQIGHQQPVRLTYVRVERGMVISVPDMPAQTCDVCGFQEFERESLWRLEALIGQVGLTPNPARSAVKVQPQDTNTTQGLKP